MTEDEMRALLDVLDWDTRTESPDETADLVTWHLLCSAHTDITLAEVRVWMRPCMCFGGMNASLSGSGL